MICKNELYILFYSTPLPPLPTEKKQLTACNTETPSNRSSASSSSAYGHLLSTEEQGTDDEDIYSKPMVTVLLFVKWGKKGKYYYRSSEFGICFPGREYWR
jgi:hypothetical protein